MAGKGKTPWQKDPRILTRMGQVEDLHLMGWTNVAIAAALTKANSDKPAVQEYTVRDDLKRLKVVWHERLGDDMQVHRDRAVTHYRRIQRAAWAGVSGREGNEPKQVGLPEHDQEYRGQHRQGLGCVRTGQARGHR